MSEGSYTVRITRIDDAPFSVTEYAASDAEMARLEARRWWGTLRGEPCVVAVWQGTTRLSARSTLRHDALTLPGPVLTRARALGCERQPLIGGAARVTRGFNRTTTHYDYRAPDGTLVGTVQARRVGKRMDVATACHLAPDSGAIIGGNVDWLLRQYEASTEDAIHA